MPTYKLKYFKSTGRAELARIMFALGGQDFEDVRFTMEEFKEKEKAGTPFGQLPVLEVDGKPYTQGNGIARYLAKKFGFYGKDDLEFLGIEQVLGIADDVSNAMIRMYYEKDEKRKAELEKENKEEKLPFYLKCLEKVLESNGGSGYCVGDTITLADVCLFNLSDYLKETLTPKDFPRICKCNELVAANPKVKAWLEIREARNK